MDQVTKSNFQICTCCLWLAHIHWYKWNKEYLQHACLHRFRWRTCWTNRHRRQQSYPMAFDHLVECHAPSNTTPSKHCQFGHQLVQHVQRYIHAMRQNGDGSTEKSNNNGKSLLNIKIVQDRTNNIKWVVFIWSILRQIMDTFHRIRSEEK